MHAFVFFLLTLCLFSTISFANLSKTLIGFSIDLIHRDSPISPFYNPSLTPSQLIRNAASRSISRSNQFSLTMKNQIDQLHESIIVPDHGDYLMKIFIGTPPVERLAIADTGSDLIWVQCSSCYDCFPQEAPLFEPNNSSTYTRVSCESQACQLLPPGHICGYSGECAYLYDYGDKSFTFGELGSDQINFGSTGVTFPKSIFGCGYHNHFTFKSTGKPTGLVGLGGGPLSLVSQLGDQIGHKFSYCLLPFSSTTNSKLKFGSDSTIVGNGVVSTPLIIKEFTPTFYYLNLEGITVGNNTVRSGQVDGNIIIDSGTTLTYLEYTFYNDFETMLQEAIGVEEVQDISSPFSFCFMDKANMSFPDITFHFTGANILLSPKNLLVKFDNNLLCLAVVPAATYSGLSIFGNMAQIDFQVGYDLQGGKVSFAPTDCAKN